MAPVNAYNNTISERLQKENDLSTKNRQNVIQIFREIGVPVRDMYPRVIGPSQKYSLNMKK